MLNWVDPSPAIEIGGGWFGGVRKSVMHHAALHPPPRHDAHTRAGEVPPLTVHTALRHCFARARPLRSPVGCARAGRAIEQHGATECTPPRSSKERSEC